MKSLTLQMLKDMEPGIFATGTVQLVMNGSYPRTSMERLRSSLGVFDAITQLMALTTVDH
jgi:hypothetical protein